jgi:FkbM family methyltransferase
MFCLSKSEAHWLYQEVRGYIQHGIELRPGAVVVDVGANVGAFSLYVNRLLDNDVDTYSCEPIPELFAVLSQNAKAQNPDRWRCLCVGIAEASRSAEFNYYPKASAISNAYGGDRALVDLVQDVLVRNPQHAPFPGNLLRFVPKNWRQGMVRRREQFFFKSERVVCQLRPLSEVIKEAKLERIDLLKIDVERCEMAVLRGISPLDWAKIQQVVVEVHDLDGRVEQVKALLRGQGLEVLKVEQEDFFKGSENYNLYAKRR